MRRITQLPLHPLLFAAAFVLQPATLNGVEPAGYIRPLAVSVAAASITVGIGRVLAGSWARAGMVASVLFVVLVSREPLRWFLAFLRDSLGIGTAIVVTGVLATFAIWALVVALRTASKVPTQWLPWCTRALNIFGIALVTGSLVLGSPTTWGWLTREKASEPANVAGAAQRPDIFVILLDGYARDDVLRREFGFDNEPFLDQLTALGFDVDRASHSNYTYSALTFTSVFETGYVREEPVASVSDEELRDRLHSALESGPAVGALHAAGYETVGTAAGWEHDSFRGRVDRFLDRPELTDFERQVLQRTWLLDLPLVPSNLFFQELHKRVTGVLGDAGLVGTESRSLPVFAFVHVAAPHLPMAFAADGGPAEFSSRLYGAGRASEFGLTEAEYRTSYGQSLSALNERVIESVRAIRHGAALGGRPEPAIVILSDHGYIGDEPIHGPPMLANLFASALPEASRPWADPPTPVNLIPSVLHAYGLPAPPQVADRFFTTVTDRGLYLTEIAEPTR